MLLGQSFVLRSVKYRIGLDLMSRCGLILTACVFVKQQSFALEQGMYIL